MDNLFLSGYIVPNYVTDDCVLLNKDCKDILNCIKRESIDLFCSDIPYRIAHKGGGIKKDGKKYMGRYVRQL